MSKEHCGPKMATTSQFSPQATPLIPHSTCRWACYRYQCGRKVWSLFLKFRCSPQILTRGIWIHSPFQSQTDCRSRPPSPDFLKEVHAMTATLIGSTHQRPAVWDGRGHPSLHRVGRRFEGLRGRSKVKHPPELYPAVSWGYRPIPLISYRCRPSGFIGSSSWSERF